MNNNINQSRATLYLEHYESEIPQTCEPILILMHVHANNKQDRF